ncbi:MAG: Gfo/Idh/MocA family oxidoreductase [Firmicutes bacterium]|nr:Gfo/Idh/MocA family oxidoreductase [Bacillota bacterium]
MGFGQKVHAPGFFAHERFELVAVAGARPGTARDLARAAGAQAYDDWREMVAEADVDLVSIATAPHLHAPVALAALARGRHILLEKPTAMDAREAGQVVEAARTAGRVGAIVHEFRYRPERLAAWRAVRAGELGRVVAVHVTTHNASLGQLSQAPVGWLFRAETGGGYLGAIASHAVDTVQWWLDEEVVRVWADLRATLPFRPAQGGGTERVTAEDAFVLFLQFASGAVGTIVFSTAGAGFGERWEVLGERGALRVEGGRTLFVPAGGEVRELDLEPLPPAPALPGGAPDPRTPPFLRLLDRLARALDGDDGVWAELAGLTQGLRVQRVLDGARLASATGGAVRILP